MPILALLSQYLPRYKTTKDVSNIVDISSATPGTVTLYNSFKLPITYLGSDKIHSLSPVVVQDLELIQSPTDASNIPQVNLRNIMRDPTPSSPSISDAGGMSRASGFPGSTEQGSSGSSLNTTITVHSPAIYEQLFQPSHAWGKLLVPEWGKQFSSDKDFLSDTQEVLTAMPQYQDAMESNTCISDTTCNEFQEIWDAVHHHDFLEKHHYMEWDCLKYLNESPLFLQLLSVGNIMSPLISLLVPILFLVCPFLILKIQGTPITFELYIQVLQEIAKNHFIGKAIVGIRSMSVDKLIYVALMFGLYLMQIYQNVMVCRRFYDHTLQMNRHLLNLRKYVEYSCRSMNVFTQLHRTKNTYRKFLEETHKHVNQLTQLSDILEVVSPFQMNLQKVGELGTMLQLYYTVHQNKEFQESLQYSVGFEGYMDNLRGVSRHVQAGNVSMASFQLDNDAHTDGEDQEDVSGSLSTPLNILNGTPVGVPLDASRATLPENQLKRTDIFDVRSNSNVHRCKINSTEFTNQYYPPLLLRNQDGCGIVKNTVCMDKNMILTGPNASGKTTLLKTTAMNVIFTQQLGCGFYSQGCLTEPYTHIHSYLNIPDTSERDSLFQAEARRCKEIIDIISGSTEVSIDIKSRHFCIFDELYSGTNPKEASKAAYAFLKYLSTYPNVDFILTTHYTTVCRKFRKEYKDEKSRVRNHQMSVELQEGGGIKYMYRVRRGISKVEGAVRILKDMNYPPEILEFFT